MLIRRVPDEGAAGELRRPVCTQEAQDHSQEYQTASELFQLMTKNQAFDMNNSPLNTSDLVILYKNIDLSTKLLPNTNELKRPNQHVETVVYNDDADSDSDLSEMVSNENLNDVFQINQERIDVLNAPLSLENTLCYKFGDLELQTPNLAIDYDKYFVFKDPYIKEQLKSFTSKELHDTILPSSLLDYICCKRLEDNYNFYMENVIRYVKNTIEQLKRISNGDYLTERTKQKWREVERDPNKTESDKIILATSTSIPLHVERKVLTDRTSMRDELVHSEVDVRSLSKILEKKIFLQVPKIICESYRLFSKRCADNLIISCKRMPSCEISDDRKKSRVDVVLKLKRSNSGHVVSNINSVMILQTSPLNYHDSSLPDILPLPIFETKESTLFQDKKENNVKIVELDDLKYGNTEVCSPRENCYFLLDTESNSNSHSAANALTCSDYKNMSSIRANNLNLNLNINNDECVVFNATQKNILKSKLTESFCQEKTTLHHLVNPDDLCLSMCKLNIQPPLPEESLEDLQYQVNKKKSFTRVRIKSPYENKSYVMEEKKRKKLLEIRERREKKKMAMSESCRIVKHKYGTNRTMMPQSVSSVTKLSITNKSFYNSIYGHNDNKQQKAKKGKKVSMLDVSEAFSVEEKNDSLPTPDNNKYINRSFYLDDTVTEIMRLQMKKDKIDKEICSASTSSAVSTDLVPHFSILSQLINHADVECKDNNKVLERSFSNDEECSKDVSDSQSAHNIVPVNTPKDAEVEEKIDFKDVSSTLEFRKSIDKIYDLIKKPIETDTSEKSSKIKFVNLENIDVTSTYRDSSAVQASDSGTSLKHHRTFSDDSGFSFQNTNNSEHTSHTKHAVSETRGNRTTVTVPKVIIQTKSQIQKTDPEKYKNDRKKVTLSNPKTVADNPLKAISHLLHEFENVKKLQHKGLDTKTKKKVETAITDGRNSCRQRSSLRRSRFDSQLTNRVQLSPKNVNITTSKDKKPTAPTDIPKILHQQIPAPEKSNDKFDKKKISDIIDEAKEARGEAIRGPSKISRLNTLAQPKRSYVQAHSEEFQNKYGRNLMADRLQRLAGTPQTPLSLEKNVVFSNWRKARTGPEIISSVSVKQPPRTASPLEKGRQRSSTRSSPERYKRPPTDTSCKHDYVGDAPETLKNKMVAVESYVKLHYGRLPPAAAVPSVDSPAVHKSRIPLVPTGIELLSLASSPMADESTALGNKLHNLIDTMFSSISPALDTLSECPETNGKFSNTDESISEHFSKDEIPHVDIFKEENICEAVKLTEEDEHYNRINFDNVENKYNIKSFKSATEIHRLDNALQRKVSSGSFQKRLRIKRLTLTPKQSMQQVMILQSGDAKSFLKESLQQNLEVNIRYSKHKSDLDDFRLLTDSRLNWNCTEIPMQISTVGYTFPTYQKVPGNLGESMNSSISNGIRTKKGNNSPTNHESDKPSNCFKGLQINLSVMDIDQVDDCDFSNTPKKINKKAILTSEAKDFNKLESIDIKKGHLSSVYKDDVQVDTLEHTINDKSDKIEYTNSLDLLVALLNEIQKITTCQTLVNSVSDELHHKQYETVLKDATLETVINNPRELISLTSLDNVKRLDSNPSIYSLYLSNNREHETRENETCITPVISTTEKVQDIKPVYANKEISVNIPDKYANMFTGIPSKLFNGTINYNIKKINSLITVVSKPSTRSVMSYEDYYNVYSNASTYSQKKIIALSSVKRTEFKNSLNTFEIVAKPSKDNNDKSNIFLPSEVTDNVETKPKEIIIPKIMKSVSNPKYYISGIEKDTAMKIKRDILVTLYSVLVFTVFAALSFPELMYHR